jgi:hypothetical protein
MCLLGHRNYFCDGGAARHARGFCADQIANAFGLGRDAQGLSDDTMLIASELVTNSVGAGCGEVSLDLVIHRRRLLITVADNAIGTPALQLVSAESTSGRGLYVVDQLAASWGVLPADNGKSVWAELAVPPELTTTISCSE